VEKSKKMDAALIDSDYVVATTLVNANTTMATQKIQVDIPILLAQLIDHILGIFEHFKGIGEIVVQIALMVIGVFGFQLQPWMGGVLSILVLVFGVYMTYKSSRDIVKYGGVLVIGLTILATLLATIF